MDKAQMVGHNRTWETIGFVVGILFLIGYGAVELYVFVRCHVAPCVAQFQASHTPLLVAGGLLIAPKMIGRARAGKIVETVLTLKSGKAEATAVVNPTTETKKEVASKPPQGGE